MWHTLNNIENLTQINESKDIFVIFKHSTRCVISDRVKKIFERDYQKLNMQVPAFLLSIIENRELSNHIAELYQVHHESPQLLLIHKGECIFAPSHADILAEEIQEEILRVTTNIQN